jgi:uncharacterized membrane protein
MLKKIIESKIFWVNVIGIVAIVAQAINGSFVIGADAQASILAGINIVLSLITKDEIKWN